MREAGAIPVPTTRWHARSCLIRSPPCRKQRPHRHARHTPAYAMSSKYLTKVWIGEAHKRQACSLVAHADIVCGGWHGRRRPWSGRHGVVLYTVQRSQKHAGPLQKAARRACRNAIEFNSLPSMNELIPGGKANMKLHVKIGTPRPVRV